MPVMPWSAELIVLIAWPMPSLRPFKSPARWLRPLAAKNAVGPSSAELTLLPVARRTWVRFNRVVVCCSRRRLLRIPAESWTSLLAMKVAPFWRLEFMGTLFPRPSGQSARLGMGSNFPASRSFLPLHRGGAENRACGLTFRPLQPVIARQFLPKQAIFAGLERSPRQNLPLRSPSFSVLNHGV